MKVVEETFCQLLQKAWCLWRKQIFVYIDEDFAIIGFVLNFKNLLLTVKIRIRVAERGSLKNIRKRCIFCYSKVVHNIKLPLHVTYSEYTVHMHNQL